MEKRIALVTGGTGGIGTSICEALAASGHHVIATYSEPSKKEAAEAWLAGRQDKGIEADVVCMNVADAAACEAAGKDILARYGRLDVLVNNAGITRDSVMKKMPVSHWDAVIGTNLDSVFYVTRVFLDAMLAQGYGRIINISSINAQKGQFGQVNYSAAKAGMHGFTKALAQETARKGITVNTVSPGYIATRMIMAIEEGIREKIREQIPVGRFGQPEDIARVVAFLADEQSSFITGANFSINGGQFMQ